MPAVITFRRFKNTDPPALADVWNESHPARSAYPLRTPALLERWVFSKPYFDHDGLIVATDADNKVQYGRAQQLAERETNQTGKRIYSDKPHSFTSPFRCGKEPEVEQAGSSGSLEEAQKKGGI